MSDNAYDPELERKRSRRRFIQTAAAGTGIFALGCWYVLGEDELTRKARKQKLADGRPRLPPGQRVIRKLKPMGGEPGNPQPAAFGLRVHGEVTKELYLDYRELTALPAIEQTCDVHCVTGWSVLDSRWKGVRMRDLAERAGVTERARFVIIEAAHGYTANITIEDALRDDALIAYRLDGKPIPGRHGAPVRALVPQRYFWKSAKWVIGLKFVHLDDPGYWEVRGYHNRADPWKEERHG